MDCDDMEMNDFDIPQPDELEWLEANSHRYSYEEEEEQLEEENDPLIIQQPPEEEEEEAIRDQPKPTLSIPPIPQPQPQIPTKKRLRSDGPDLLQSISRNEDGSREKRGRLDESDDEEWMRYEEEPASCGTMEEPVVLKKKDEEKLVSRYAFEIQGDCVPVTGFEGERVYAKVRNSVEMEREREGRFDRKSHYNCLISEPIHAIMQRVESEAFTKALNASVECQSEAIQPETPVVTEKLWVEKYAPSSFMELLSDEQTNREVLFWLKKWDSCVFGSEIRATKDDVLSSLRHHSSVAQKQKISRIFSSKFRESKFGKETYNHPNGESNDPIDNSKLGNKTLTGSAPTDHKILLLCGPPGLGKTTLAHVAAKHCGYRVVEINASDDRSSSAIEGKILDVVQMNSVMADSKPNCLVIDEIDGALGDGKGAVEVILKMLSADRKSDIGKENVREEQHGKTSSRKKQKAASLSRPVICICNDLYAPALRPLRQVAKVHIFVQPTVSRVVSRLKYICSKEGLKASSIALTALAEYTECDIRSCLNTLQFLHKKKETLNVLEISSQVVGRKDTSKSIFEIWKEIFQKRKPKRERKLDNCSSESKGFDFMHSLVSGRGDYDLILDGVHENVLQLHYNDPLMHKTVKCLDRLGMSDLIHQYIMSTQQMSLLAYQSIFVVYIRALVAQHQRPTIEWPKSYQRCRTMLMEKTENLRSWHNKISPNISRHLSTKSLVQDSISSLLHILSPPKLRPVAVHLLSEKERNDMSQLVNTMVAYSISYKNLKPDAISNHLRAEAAVETWMLSFDPPLADLIAFKGYKSSHFALAAAVKQVLVHEVVKQKILQGSINRSKESSNVEPTRKQALPVDKSGTPQSLSQTVFPRSENLRNSKDILSSRQSKMTAKAASSVAGSSESTAAIIKVASSGDSKKRRNGSFNFFERFKKLGSNSTHVTDIAKQKPATSERDSRPLLFKYNEGYTNAVKRPVRMREFL